MFSPFKEKKNQKNPTILQRMRVFLTRNVFVLKKAPAQTTLSKNTFYH